MKGISSQIKLMGLFTLVLILFGFSCEKETNEVPDISIPTPKIERFSNSVFNISKYSSIIDSNYLDKYKSAISSLKSTITSKGSNNKSGLEIVFQMVADSLNTIQAFRKYVDLDESYAIQFSDQKIIIQSKSELGLLNGLTTLEYFIIKNKGKLKQGLIIDYPDIKKRVLHLPLWPGDLETYKNTIRLARFNHFNTLILLIFKGVKLKSLDHLVTEDALSKQEFRELVNYAKENGLEVIPELKLLSHQEKFFGQTHPELMFNKSTYNPQKKNVYNYVFAAINEIVGLTGATKFHIGHDEVRGFRKLDYDKGRLREGESPLPAELFLYDVDTINDYLNEKNIETWMWGDMLIWAKQYPTLKSKGAFHGNKSYSVILDELPKNITICDWHYNETQTNFPSTYEFAKDGFKVYGATWQNKQTTRNYAKYSSTMPENVEGMIATTWYRIDRKNEEVLDIINFSGETFWNAKD